MSCRPGGVHQQIELGQEEDHCRQQHFARRAGEEFLKAFKNIFLSRYKLKEELPWFISALKYNLSSFNLTHVS